MEKMTGKVAEKISNVNKLKFNIMMYQSLKSLWQRVKYLKQTDLGMNTLIMSIPMLATNLIIGKSFQKILIGIVVTLVTVIAILIVTLNRAAETISPQQDFRQQNVYKSTSDQPHTNMETQYITHQDTEFKSTYNDEDKWK